MIVGAVAARAWGLRTARGRRVTAGAPGFPLLFLLGDGGRRNFGYHRSLGNAARLLFGPAHRLFGGGFLGLAIVFGAAALFFRGGRACVFFAAARVLKGRHPRLVRLAQQAGLQLTAGADIVLRRRAAGLRRGRGRLGRRARGLGDGFGLGRLGRRRFARTAKDAPLLDLDNDRVRTAVAEALFDLAGLDRALEAQRRPGAKLRFFGLVCHSIPSSSLLQPSRSSRRVLHLPDLDRGQ